MVGRYEALQPERQLVGRIIAGDLRGKKATGKIAEVIATITEERRLFPEDRLFWFMWRRMRLFRGPSRNFSWRTEEEQWAWCRIRVAGFRDGWQTKETEDIVEAAVRGR